MTATVDRLLATLDDRPTNDRPTNDRLEALEAELAAWRTPDVVERLEQSPDAFATRAEQVEAQARAAREQRVVLALLRRAARLAADFAAVHDACCSDLCCEPRLQFFFGGQRDEAGRRAAAGRNAAVAGVAFMADRAADALAAVTPDGPDLTDRELLDALTAAD